MERTFKLKTNYYDERKLFKHNTVTIKDGITVLIGCNGSGKSTLLRHIDNALVREEIPCFLYNNIDNVKHGVSDAVYHNNFELASSLWTASEGESISINIMSMSDKLTKFVEHGTIAINRIADILSGEKKAEITTNERWILFDALDSGYSIDQVRDMKELLLHDLYDEGTKDGYDIHIVISCNEYELARNEQCLNVIECKYVDISSYDKYAKEIMNTRKYKDLSWERYSKKLEKEDPR